MTTCVHELPREQCDLCSAPRPAHERSPDEIRREFEEAAVVTDDVRTRVERLAAEFAKRSPTPRPKAIAFRDEYAQLFSEEGLERVTAAELHRFANSDLVAGPGIMSVFNTEWRRWPESDARDRLVEVIRYLLYGPLSVSIP